MTTQRRKGIRAIAVVLAFAMAQLSIQLSFAEPTSSATLAPMPQQFVARLTTTGNQPITVNGASAASGASILTGAMIETPAATSATIDLGALGSVELAPNTLVQLDFADDGTVRVKVLRGCVKVKKSGPSEADMYTAEGASEKTNSGRRGLGFCYLNGTLDPIGQSAAAGGGAGGEGLGAGVTAAIIISAIAVPLVLWAALHGRGGTNPSPSTP